MKKISILSILLCTILIGCKPTSSTISPVSSNKDLSVDKCVNVSSSGNNSPAIVSLGDQNNTTHDSKCVNVSTSGNNSPAIGNMNNSSINYN